MEDIIKEITEAEQRASEIKAQAYAEAAEIAARAEVRSREILKASEAELKIFREEQIKTAEESAQKVYLLSVSENAAEAREYADGIIGNTERQVNQIIGRICGGGR